jgi:hypothetical protein
MTNETYSLDDATAMLLRRAQNIAAKVLLLLNIALASFCILLGVTLLLYFTFSSTRGLKYSEAVLNFVGMPLYASDEMVSLAFGNTSVTLPRQALVRVRQSFLTQENELVFALNWRSNLADNMDVTQSDDYIVAVVRPYSLEHNTTHFRKVLIDDFDNDNSTKLSNNDMIVPSRQNPAVTYYLTRENQQPILFKCEQGRFFMGATCNGVFDYQQNITIQYRFPEKNIADWQRIEAAIVERLQAYFSL